MSDFITQHPVFSAFSLFFGYLLVKFVIEATEIVLVSWGKKRGN